MSEQPTVVEIHIAGPCGEVTIKHVQQMDSTRTYFVELDEAPMKRAAADAASWLRRNGKAER